MSDSPFEMLRLPNNAVTVELDDVFSAIEIFKSLRDNELGSDIVGIPDKMLKELIERIQLDRKDTNRVVYGFCIGVIALMVARNEMSLARITEGGH